MDRHRFDDFTRRLATGASRRKLLAAMVAGGVGAAFGSRAARAQEGLLGPGEPCASTQECSQTGGPLVCAENYIAEDGPLTCCRMQAGACTQNSHCCGMMLCVEGFCLGDGEPAATAGLPLGADCTDNGQCAAIAGANVVCGDNYISEDGPLNCCLEEGSACAAGQECCGTFACDSGFCGAAAGGGDLAPGEFCVTSSQCTQALGPATCGDNAFSGGAPVCCLQEASTCASDQECCGQAVCASNGITGDGRLNCCGYTGATCSSDPGCCADLFCFSGTCQPL